MSGKIDSDESKYRLRSLKTNPNWSEYTIPERTIAGVGVLVIIALSVILYPHEIIKFGSELDEGYITAVKSIAPEIGLILSMVVVHELIHYGVALAEGKKPQFGLRIRKTIGLPLEIDPYVIALEQRISRNENIFMLISPLLVINSLAVLTVLFSQSDIAIYYAQLVFFVNSVGSISDIYNVIRLLSFPKTTEFVNIVDDEVRTFFTVTSN